MKQMMYILSVLFLTGWIIGFFVFGMGMVVHVFLFIAAITLMQGLIICPKRKQKAASTLTADSENVLCI